MNCKSIKDFLVIIVIGVAGWLLYRYTLVHCFEQEYRHKVCAVNTVVKIDSLTKAEMADTVNVYQFINKVDSIAKVTADIHSHYQEDINLMIYKTTQWLTFWLGIMTIIAGLVGLLQYFRNRRYDEEFKKLKEGIETFKDKIQNDSRQAYKDYNSTTTTMLELYKVKLSNQIESKYSGIDVQVADMAKKLEELSCNIRRSEAENRISTLMTCISSFPDPAMFSSTPKRKIYVQFYLSKLYSEFSEYLKIVKAVKKDDLTENDLNRLSLALNSVKYVVVRTQSAYSDYHQNVTFNNLVMAINGMLEEIIEKGIVEGDMNEKLNKISEMFNKMIHSIIIDER